MLKILIFILLIILPGCGPKQVPLPNLDNIAIPASWNEQTSITLKNGSYSEPSAPHSASETSTRVSPYFARGNIDGQEILAAILITTSGGSGTFYDLLVFTEENHTLVYMAQVPLGDRIKINRIGVTENQIKVSLATRNNGTAMGAEPDLPLIKSFRLANGQLTKPCKPKAIPIQSQPPLSLTGRTYYWQSSLYGNDTQEIPQNPSKYTITFNTNWTIDIQANDQILHGFFGLNRTKLTIKVDHATKHCPTNSQCSIFLKDLNDAVNFLFQDQNLYIDLIYDSGTLILTKHP